MSDHDGDERRDSGGFNATCPVPVGRYREVLLGHGGGGRLMRDLLRRQIVPALGGPLLAADHDGALLENPAARLAFTTDSYVVRPRFFPGGDIGSLAVYGTVNDLLMCGARPRWLSVGLIIEEGLAMAELDRVVASLRAAAERCRVEVATGDTKVVERGNGDGLFINTAGIGVVAHAQTVGPKQVRAGDVVLLNGDLGRHGIAVLASREGLEFETTITSDAAPLDREVEALLASSVDLHCLRDLTRGGLAAACVEIAETAAVELELDEAAIPVGDAVRGACEMLGLEPIHVANEGRFLAIVPEAQAERAMAALDGTEAGEPACIGRVRAAARPQVTLRTELGSRRLVDLPSGEQLPRIC